MINNRVPFELSCQCIIDSEYICIQALAKCCAADEHGVIALGKAQRILQGESPCRERSNQPPVSSVDLVEELGN